MSKRTVYTAVTPLPAGITRESVLATLRNHFEMIDLNPLVIHREPCKPPGFATPEEYHCIWYAITDRISYLPGVKGKVTYYACFNDLAKGLQTHCYAPMGLDIKGKWTLGGNLPGEPREAAEFGVGMPRDGLWLREDIDFSCNIVLTSFVKKNLKNAHKTLVERLVEKAKLREVAAANQTLGFTSPNRESTFPPGSPTPTHSHPFHPPGSPGLGIARPPSMYSQTSSHPSVLNTPRVQSYIGPDGQPMVSPDYQQMDPAYAQAMGYYNPHQQKQVSPRPDGRPVELLGAGIDPRNPKAAKLPQHPVELAG